MFLESLVSNVKKKTHIHTSKWIEKTMDKKPCRKLVLMHRHKKHETMSRIMNQPFHACVACTKQPCLTYLFPITDYACVDTHCFYMCSKNNYSHSFLSWQKLTLSHRAICAVNSYAVKLEKPRAQNRHPNGSRNHILKTNAATHKNKAAKSGFQSSFQSSKKYKQK